MNHYIIYGSFIHGGHIELQEDPSTGVISRTAVTFDHTNWDVAFDNTTSTLFKSSSLPTTSELENVCSYRPVRESLHIFDESSSDQFSNFVVEEYKISGQLSEFAFKWYNLPEFPGTLVLNFNDDYFIDIISGKKLPKVFNQTQLRNKLSFTIQQRIRDRSFNDISDCHLGVIPVADGSGDHVFDPTTLASNRYVLDTRYEKQKAVTILKFCRVTQGQRLRLESIFAHEYVYTNEDSNKNMNR